MAEHVVAMYLALAKRLLIEHRELEAGEFDLEFPLLDLPNVLGCPHNSAQVPEIHDRGLRRATRNVVATLSTAGAENAVDREHGY